MFTFEKCLDICGSNFCVDICVRHERRLLRIYQLISLATAETPKKLVNPFIFVYICQKILIKKSVDFSTKIRSFSDSSSNVAYQIRMLYLEDYLESTNLNFISSLLSLSHLCLPLVASEHENGLSRKWLLLTRRQD